MKMQGNIAENIHQIRRYKISHVKTSIKRVPILMQQKRLAELGAFKSHSWFIENLFYFYKVELLRCNENTMNTSYPRREPTSRK